MRWAREGSILVAAALALPLAGQGPVAAARTAAVALAAEPGAGPAATGEIFGLVTDAGGRREAGAVVLVRGEGWNSPALRRVTSTAGLFTLAGLKPGVYYVEVGKGGRLAARQRVAVHASERALLLVNLPQLLQSVQFGAPPGSQPDQAFDWALRQATVWRPILRLDDTNAGPLPEEEGEAAPVAGYVAFTAGGGTSALDSPDLATAFSVDSGLWDGERLALTGEVGTNSLGSPSDTRVQASFHAANADNPNRLMVAVRQV
ncbi:MAG: carboxypeptidase-like regulatory domain-containing protein, partial [Terriglobales bacterium]